MGQSNPPDLRSAVDQALRILDRPVHEAYPNEVQAAAHAVAGSNDALFNAVIAELELRNEYQRKEPDREATGGGPEAMNKKVEEELDRLRVRHRAEQALRSELAGPPRPLGIATLAERLANPLPPIEFRVEGWQPKSTRGILTAAFKAGKTTLIGNLIRSLVDGESFLEAAEVDPLAGALGLLDFEMSTRMLDQWLADQKISNTDQVVLLPLRGNAAAFNIVNPDTRSEWAQRLRQYGIQYLIVDPLRPVLDALALNEHTEAGIFLQAFDQLLTEADVSEALVSHHHGHGAERARGDSRLRDWQDFEWKLVRQNEDPASARYISAYGRDIDVGESLLTYKDETRRLILTGGSRRYAEVRGALAEIEKALDSQDAPGAPMTQNAVERTLADSDYGRATIRKALIHGVREGRLVVTSGPNRAKLYSRLASAPEYAAAHRRTETVSGAPPLYKGAPPNTTAEEEHEETPSAHPLPCGECGHPIPGSHRPDCSTVRDSDETWREMAAFGGRP